MISSKPISSRGISMDRKLCMDLIGRLLIKTDYSYNRVSYRKSCSKSIDSNHFSTVYVNIDIIQIDELSQLKLHLFKNPCLCIVSRFDSPIGGINNYNSISSQLPKRLPPLVNDRVPSPSGVSLPTAFKHDKCYEIYKAELVIQHNFS